MSWHIALLERHESYQHIFGIYDTFAQIECSHSSMLTCNIRLPQSVLTFYVCQHALYIYPFMDFFYDVSTFDAFTHLSRTWFFLFCTIFHHPKGSLLLISSRFSCHSRTHAPDIVDLWCNIGCHNTMASHQLHLQFEHSEHTR